MDRSWTNVTFTKLENLQYNGVGAYMYVSFVIAAPFHILALIAMVVNPKIFKHVTYLPEITLMLSDLGVLSLHLFSGASALMRYWVWGPGGCQLYSFFGFFFGSYQLCAVPLVSYARFKEMKTPIETSSDRSRMLKLYVKLILFLLLFSIFWALCPIFGWAQYARTQSGITCTIDWQKNDVSFITYNVAYTIFGFIIPMMIMIFYTAQIFKLLPTPAAKVSWARRGSSAHFVTLGCGLSTYIAFSGYGAICIYCMVANPADLSTGANLLPPPMAKTAGIMNAFFYVYMNPTIWAAIKKMLGCAYEKKLLEIPSTESGQNVPFRVGENFRNIDE